MKSFEIAKIVEKVINILLGLFLCGIFVASSYKALLKYQKEPFSTETYSILGDDPKNKTIKYPVLTICDKHFVKNSPLLLSCANGTLIYGDAVLRCLESKEDFDIERLIESLQINSESFFKDIGVFTLNSGNKTWSGDQMEGVWQPVIHYKLGPCQRINLHLIPFFKNYTITNDTIPIVKIVLQRTLNWAKDSPLKVMIHNPLDASDALDLQPLLEVRRQSNQIYVAKLRKKITSMEPARRYPCKQYTALAEANRAFYKHMIKRFNCTVEFLFNDTYLDDLRQPGLKSCVKETLLKRTYPYDSDAIKLSCDFTEYSMSLKTFATPGGTDSELHIAFSSVMMERSVTFISYDFQSLISEVGGLLGLTLGWSGMSMGTSLITKAFSKFNIQ